jgi:hypothetical protein
MAQSIARYPLAVLKKCTITVHIDPINVKEPSMRKTHAPLQEVGNEQIFEMTSFSEIGLTKQVKTEFDLLLVKKKIYNTPMDR